MAQITFYTGTKAEYLAATKDPNGIYFVTDENAIYKGDIKYTGDEIKTGTNTGTVGSFLVGTKEIVVHGLKDGAALSKTDINGLITAITNPISEKHTEDVNSLEKKIKEAKDAIPEIPVATADSKGIVQPSSDFDISDGVISLYKAPSVTAFSLSNTNSQYELGQSVSNIGFSYSFNKTPASAVITGTNISSTSLSIATTGTKSIATTSALKSNGSYTIQMTDARGAKASKTVYINFLNKKYWGVSSETNAANVNSAFLLKLSNQLASGRTGTVSATANAGQYIYFAIPASFGTPVFYVGGFEGGFDLFKTFDFTNASGYTTSYNVYKSINANLGSTSVEVK